MDKLRQDLRYTLRGFLNKPGFSALALLLAGVGIYGVIAYAVSQRPREIGIRIALGAERSDVLVHVVSQSVVPLLVGLGLAGAFVLTRFVAAFLYGVNPTDPVTFAATPIVMVIVALCAAYLPARRAVTVDPTAALRQE